MRVVLPAGSEPASAEPRRIEKNGTASTSITAAAAAAISAGRSLTRASPAAPARRLVARGQLPGGEPAACLATEHAGAEEPEQRGQQRQRGDDGEQDGDACRDRDAVEEAHAEGEHAEQGDADGDSGEHDCPPGGVDRVDDRLLGRLAALQSLPEARDDEQRVVDADAEADQQRELRAEGSHVQHVGEQCDHRDRASERDPGGQQRQRRGQQRAEHQEQDDQRRSSTETDGADAGSFAALAT